MTEALRGWANGREAEAAREEAEATLERSVWYWRGKQVAYREMQQLSEPARADTATLCGAIRPGTNHYPLTCTLRSGHESRRHYADDVWWDAPARADTAALDVDRLARVLAKAVCLDTEWRKTEEAMPPGWWFELYLAPHREGEVNPHTGIALGPQPGPYVASAQPLWSDGSQLVQVSGDSTAAALRALRAALEATDD